MRIYMGGLSRPNLRKARRTAPSHVFGTCWTPSDRRLNEIPFFVDNGAFTSSFDPDEWIALLDSLDTYSYKPDFVVLPDVYNDAEGTIRRHREYVEEVRDRNLPVAHVLQPGLDPEMQIILADRLEADWIFLGGRTRWQRRHGREIVEQARDRDLPVHVGNPGGEKGLRWAYQIGAESVDTTTINRNEYWHYLEALEEIT